MNNYGVILEPPKYEDYCFGGFSAVQNKVLVENGNWSEYLPVNEKQHSLYMDTMACVTFSSLNIIETLFNYYIQNKLICLDDIKWLNDNGYLDNNGNPNFSDRYTAKLSGTTKNGNTGYKVSKSIRNDGLVPESKWSYPREQKTPVFDWGDYYKDIPQELKDLGKEFLKRFEVKSEIVYKEKFEEALRTSPIQVYVIAWYEKDGVYYSPKGKKQNHAVMKQITTHNIYDSYDPFVKKLTEDFDYYYYGYKYNIIFKNKKNMRLVKTKDNEDVYLIDAQANKRLIIDEKHFQSLVPALGLGKDENDWSQVEEIDQSEIEKFKEERPIFVSK